ncbi:nucleotide pyrophosphohydrolase [Microlunatus panaciterrae]|uniref:NTP pyrophosphatase (Non-canonical NTP hydrolase) n=1 Tax=Microlunatus panaciterrae TaxID=400768 RepID=A0ABS2RM37_9ACTN|nr:nucleotide pyrophosphohydrolase [Microlunatus panaciterrae]MBM7798994.1 NTP pyrophosphatase (non-canonical NTP hydrolase) [Microlunatus panaciterrae]
MSDFHSLQDEIRDFIAERDWSRFHDPKSVILALVGEVGELSELFQWLPAHEAARRARDEPLRGHVAEELADVFTYLLVLADALDVDLIEAADQKLHKTRQRYPTDTSRGIAPSRVDSGGHRD